MNFKVVRYSGSDKTLDSKDLFYAARLQCEMGVHRRPVAFI